MSLGKLMAVGSVGVLLIGVELEIEGWLGVSLFGNKQMCSVLAFPTLVRISECVVGKVKAMFRLCWQRYRSAYAYIGSDVCVGTSR